jgi:hypothetical protein
MPQAESAIEALTVAGADADVRTKRQPSVHTQAMPEGSGSVQ